MSIMISNTTREYFDLLIAMRSDRRGAEALNSLDIIDTKAGGIAGLVGGFSAAAFFIIQLSLERHVTSSVFYMFSLAAILLLCLSGLFCAASLHIINHFQTFLFIGLEGHSEQEKIDIAAVKIMAIYKTRVERYIWCRYFLLAGIACLALSVAVYFVPF